MINEERVPLSRYLNAMSVFAYSSARLEILRGSPEERRRFLDRGIASVDPAYLDALSRYTRVLKQRNALLQEGTTGARRAPLPDPSQGGRGAQRAPSALDAWDEELAQAAAVVQKARETYTASLSEAFATIVERHAYHVRDLQMIYRPSLLPAKRADELRARMTLAGPQRDQLDFVMAGRPAAEVLSGGEQKMIVLFLKFAKLALFRTRFDEPAVFLLDDVDAELDLEILEQLLLRLPAETQVFATSAKERFLSALAAGPHRRLLIENGRVTAAEDFP
jgi:DNA replication and repair protein RecF